MAQAAIVNQTAGGTAQSTGGKSAPAALIPFIRATRPHRELFLDRSVTLTASDQDQGSFDVPAYGYLRNIVLLVETTTAASDVAAAGVVDEDAPFNVLKNIFFTEPNGGQIHQFNSGFDLFLANKYGGYRPEGDARASSIWINTMAATGGNFRFMLRIPCEIDERDGLGSLPNQNAGAMFKLRFSLAAIADLWGAAATWDVFPVVRIRAYIEAWDQPQANSPLGPQQTSPPALNTTQYWSSQQYPIVSGVNKIRLTRMGNFIRNIITVFDTATRRTTAVTGGEANFPATTNVYLDTLILDMVGDELWKHQMFERGGYGKLAAVIDAANGLDSAVRVYDFAHEFNGRYGYENRDQWLNTLASERLELEGSFGAAGTLTVITNDVAVVGQAFL